MNIRFVDLIDDFQNAGDAKYYTSHGGTRVGGLIIGCPGCGKLTLLPFKPVEVGAAWEWDGDRDQPTLTPSIRHTDVTCGWHGHLIRGKFVEG